MTPATQVRAQRSREAIIAAAEAVFVARGYAGASLNEIIRASGLTKGGFYYHFPSKKALALAVVREHQDRWIKRAIRDAAGYPAAVDRLFAVPRILARLTREGEGPAVIRGLFDELSHDPELRNTVRELMAANVHIVADQFREAQAEGAIRSDFDPESLAHVAVGGFVGLQTLTAQLDDDDLESRVEDLIHVVQLAILVRPENTGGNSHV